MVFTDPPYNVAYKGGTKDALTIKNDNMSSANFYRFLFDCFTAAAAVCSPGTPIYVCHSDSEGLNFRKSLIDSGWLVKSCLIWVKNQFVLGRMDYHMRHEPILYGWMAGAAHKWFGGRKNSTIIEEMPGLTITANGDGAEITFSDGVRFCSMQVPSYDIIGASDESTTTIWKVDKPQKNPDHPTTKPVEIPRRSIENSSLNGNRVLDLFLGSGSTLIACEMSGRICHGMELDPKYCDVIVRRWEQFTGRKAELMT
jgi:DNA modification methylase